MASAAAFSGSYTANLGPSIEGYLTPAVDEECESFFVAAAEGRLTIQACSSCGRLRHPPRPMCPWCQSTAREWREVSGRGTLWSFVVPHPPLLPAYSEIAPYNVIVVEIEEDPTIRFIGNLVNGPEGPINEIDPATIRIGEPVEVVFSVLVRNDGSSVAMPRWVRRAA
jgi:uncharacterized OB-fold protein